MAEGSLDVRASWASEASESRSHQVWDSDGTGSSQVGEAELLALQPGWNNKPFKLPEGICGSQ